VAGHFGFSAIRIDSLMASAYTLATIAFDVSGSTHGFSKEMEEAGKKIVNYCKNKSPSQTKSNSEY